MHAHTWTDCSWLCHTVFSCLDPSADYLLLPFPPVTVMVPGCVDRWYSVPFDLWKYSLMCEWADSSLIPAWRGRREHCYFSADQFPSRTVIYSSSLISCHRNVCTIFVSTWNYWKPTPPFFHYFCSLFLFDLQSFTFSFSYFLLIIDLNQNSPLLFLLCWLCGWLLRAFRWHYKPTYSINMNIWTAVKVSSISANMKENN